METASHRHVLLAALLASAAVVPGELPGQSRRKKLQPVPVVWLLGQSNAIGAISGYWLANPLIKENKWPHLAKQEGVKIWWPGPSKFRPDSKPGWEAYRTGSVENENNATFRMFENVFGPEASIGAAAHEHFGETVYVFKYAIVSALDPDYPKSWTKSDDGEGLYHDVITEWQLAYDQLIAQGFEPQVRGVFFVHGEAANGKDRERHYAERLKALLTNLRKDIPAVKPTDKKVRVPRRRAKPIPFVIAELHDRHTPREMWEAPEKLIRAAQAEVCKKDRYAELCPTAEFGVKPDQHATHFDEIGTVKFGFAMFEALARHLPKPKKKQPKKGAGKGELPD